MKCPAPLCFQVFLTVALMTSVFSVAQTRIGYENSYGVFKRGVADESTFETPYRYLRFSAQQRLGRHIDLRLSVATDITFYHKTVQLSAPIFFSKRNLPRQASRGFFVEPILSYRSLGFKAYGAGVGFGYQYNIGNFSLATGVRATSETSPMLQGNYNKEAYAYLGIGYWLPAIRIPEHTPEEQKLRGTRLWATPNMGSDDKLTFGLRLEMALGKVEWLSAGVEYWQGTGYYSSRDLNTGQFSEGETPMDVFYVRLDIRPVQIIRPLSRFDPYIGVGMGPATLRNIDLRFYDAGIQAGFRYWITDHFGAVAEAGVMLKLGGSFGVIYRL